MDFFLTFVPVRLVLEEQVMEEFYHFYTDGKYQPTVFLKDSDFVYGMNATALCASHGKVGIMAFCLMDNHFHFVLKGSSADVEEFARNYKSVLSKYLCRKYGKPAPLHYAKSGFRKIEDPYSLKIAIAYCLRNPFVAGIVPHPCRYSWSSAGCCFDWPGNADDDGRGSLKRVGELGVRERRRLFMTRQEIPEDYLFNGKGMIHPSCYVAVAEVKRLFSNKGNYYHYLFRRVEGMVDGEASGNVRAASVSDNVLAEGAAELLSEYGRYGKFCELSPGERDRLINELKYRYSPSDRQLARVMVSLASWQ